ncbi:MAG: hypothetical protein ABI377_10405, partial [Devosia sp.]
YYVEDGNSRTRIKGREVPATSSPAFKLRLPASEIEGAVVVAIRQMLLDRRSLLEHLNDLPVEQTGAAVAAAEQLAAKLAERHGRTEDNSVRQFLKRVTYSQTGLVLHCGREALRRTLGVPTLATVRPTNANDESDGFTVRAPLVYRRRGVQAKLSIPGVSSGRPDPALIIVIARARDWADKLISGEFKTVPEIAAAEGLSMQYVSRLMPLAFLAPDIVNDIVGGVQPANLTANKLAWVDALPHGWRDQRRLLG